MSDNTTKPLSPAHTPALREAIASQPDPLPRGKVVAGEVQELEGEGGKGELPILGYLVRYHKTNKAVTRWEYHSEHPHRGQVPPPLSEVREVVDRTAAQARIRELEREQEIIASAVQEATDDLEEAHARLERLRGVVGTALSVAGNPEAAESRPMCPTPKQVEFLDALDALLPEDREWAERED